MLGAALVACARPAAPPPATSDATEHEPSDPRDASAKVEASSIDWESVPYSTEAPHAPSTASYDEALASAEPVQLDDDRAQLTDAQLAGPIRGVLRVCPVPARAKLTIKTAVQDGRAIGVSVTVHLPPSPPPPRRASRRVLRARRAAAKAEAKAAAKLEQCVDRAVRAMSWPPSPRRDSFTTEL